MKKITNLIPAVLFAIAFCWAAGQWAGAAEPYLDGNKSIAQTWIYAENKGTPDRADVTITIRGEGDPVTEIVPQDVVFAIDSSGSMLESDPLEERLTAAKFYVDQLDINLGEKAAVVDFDDLARLVNDHHLCTDTAQVKADIDTIDMIGGTNILSAMAIANDELAGYGDPDHVWVVILLTDGQNWCMPWGTPCPELDQQMDDVNDPLIQEAINNHIAYYTIGLGSDVNETLLSNLATFTGGQYYSAPDASYLREIYDEIHQRAGTAAAGRNITVTETLTASFDYVPDSFSIPPASLAEKVAVWNIPSLRVDDERSFTFQVKSSNCGVHHPVDGDTTVQYTNYVGEPETLLLPPVFVDVTCDYPPELSGIPADETVECDAVPDPASPTGTGRCDTDVDVTLEESRQDGSCPGSYAVTRTWTATDFCGNTAAGDQVITVRDTRAPVISGVPSDGVAECDSVPPAASPTAADACDPAPGLRFDEERINGNCPYDYTLARTWTATDSCGNLSVRGQTLTVRDIRAPVLSGVPPAETVECDSVPPPAAPGASDNCDRGPRVVFGVQRMDGDCPYNYTLTRTWTALDICGNASTGLQIVTARDTGSPIVTASFEPVVSDEDEDGDEAAEGLYTIRYSGQDNCSLRVKMQATVNVFGNDESCDENPDFTGYAVRDGDRFRLNCSTAVDCGQNDELSDEGHGPVLEMTGPAARLSVAGTDECRNSAQAESLLICPDPGDCISAMTLQNSKGEEKTFYWFEDSGRTREFEVGGEQGRFDWDCRSTCLNVGDVSGTLRITCLQAGKKMARRCKVPENAFSASCPAH